MIYLQLRHNQNCRYLLLIWILITFTPLYFKDKYFTFNSTTFLGRIRKLNNVKIAAENNAAGLDQVLNCDYTDQCVSLTLINSWFRELGNGHQSC